MCSFLLGGCRALKKGLKHNIRGVFILKKIVIIFLLLSSLCSFYITFQQTDHRELEKIEKLENRIAHEFVIPGSLLLADPDEVYPILVEAAKECKVNIFRPNINNKADDTVEILKYVLLTRNTSFFDHIKIKNGSVLSVDDTQDSDFFLTTKNTNDKNQIGIIKSFGGNHHITIKPLQNSYKSLPVEGRYFVEASDDKVFNFFLNSFADKLNKYYVEYEASFTPKEFIENVSETYNESTTLVNNLTYIYYLILVILLFFIIYYIFNESKKIGIMKMHGISNLHLWWIIVGKLIIVVFVTTLIVSTFFSILVENTTVQFVYDTLINQLLTYLFILALSLASYIYLSRIRISQIIKNRKDTNGIFVLNMILKTVCSIILVLIGTSILREYVTVHDKQENLKNWEHSKDYGIFYPLYIGHDQDDFNNGAPKYKATISMDLYPILNKMGAIYIDARQYEEMSLILNRDYNGIFSVKVNNNYLQEFPIYDKHNVPVKISKDTENWVLLVPEKYQNREKEIRHFFEGEREARIKYTEDFLQIEVPNDIGDQQIDIIWLADNQEIFSFNPEVFKYQNNIIIDPIIEVLTEKNDFIKDIAILGNGGKDALKVKLINRDVALTYKTLEPELKRLKLDDNLKYLITIDQYILQEIYDLQKNLQVLLLISFGLIVGLIILVTQNLIVFFNKNQHKYVVNRLFGIGFFRTYKDYMLLFSLTWVVQLVICVIVNRGSEIRLLGVAALLIVIELIASIIALIIIERRNKLKVIKGG